MSYSKTLVIFLIIITIIFTGVVLVLMYFGMEEPVTLIRYWFTGFISELLACAGIKVTKVVRNYRHEIEDEEAVG